MFQRQPFLKQNGVYKIGCAVTYMEQLHLLQSQSDTSENYIVAMLAVRQFNQNRQYRQCLGDLGLFPSSGQGRPWVYNCAQKLHARQSSRKLTICRILCEMPQRCERKDQRHGTGRDVAHFWLQVCGGTLTLSETLGDDCRSAKLSTWRP